MEFDLIDMSNVHMVISKKRKVVEIHHNVSDFYMLYEKHPFIGMSKKLIFIRLQAASGYNSQKWLNQLNISI